MQPPAKMQLKGMLLMFPQVTRTPKIEPSPLMYFVLRQRNHPLRTVLWKTSLRPENGPMEETRANVSGEPSSEKIIQGRNLRDLSMLPYAVHDSTVTTSPITSSHTLRDRSSRQKLQRLMQVDSSGQTSTEEGEM